MGARVIKVEQPGKGDDTRAWGPPFLEGESAYFLSINRNKESVTVDFKRPEGRAILDQLLGRSDVLVENFRPGTLAKQGLDYSSIKSRFPRLVYCSVSGFGQTGPRRDEPGYDAVMAFAVTARVPGRKPKRRNGSWRTAVAKSTKSSLLMN